MKPGSKGPAVRHLQVQLSRINLYLGKTTGVYDAQTTQQVNTFQRTRRLSVDGVVGPATKKRLAYARPQHPHISSSAKQRVEINLGTQTASLIRANKIVLTFSVSTGMPGFNTPRGSFRVYSKQRMSWSNPYSTWMPWSSYFVGGVAMHEGVVPNGTSSHGCVHISPLWAKWVYQRTPYGTPVTVY